jgi:hypothetical protein
VHYSTPHCTALCLFSSHQAYSETATATEDSDREGERERECEREIESSTVDYNSIISTDGSQYFHVTFRYPMTAPLFLTVRTRFNILLSTIQPDTVTYLQNMSYHTIPCHIIPYNSIQFVHRPFIPLIPRYLLCTVYEAFSSSLHLHHTVLHHDMTSFLY